MRSSKLCHLPQETTIFTTHDFFKLQLCCVLRILQDPEIYIISIVMGTIFEEHWWSQDSQVQ